MTNYPTKKLGDIVDILDNLRKPVTRKDRKSGPYPYYGATGIQDHVASYIFDEDLVLVGEDGARWKAGDSSAYKISGKSWVNNHAHVLRPKKDILLDDWLVYCLNFPDLSEYITGTTVKKLNQEKLRSIEIPLPPLETQKKIVSKIEKLFTKIDDAQKLREEAKKDTNTLLQSAMNGIFSGPKSKVWKKKKLFEIVKIIGGGTPSKNNLSYYKGSIPWATVRDLKNDFITDTEFKISEEAVKESSTNIIPANNIILVTRVGLGKMSITSKDTAINQDLKALIPREKVELDNKYLFWWLKTKMEFIKSQGRGATVMGVRLELINNLVIPVPPIAEQRKIVARLDKLTEKVRGLQKLQLETATDLVNLKQSILTKAFKGEL